MIVREDDNGDRFVTYEAGEWPWTGPGRSRLDFFMSYVLPLVSVTCCVVALVLR